ncbi:MAG: histidine phosphatase family protein [Symploca sp. SIO2G7]|nr:histidine phosphatase family protein [Symploca sp. SIO2G7]
MKRFGFPALFAVLVTATALLAAHHHGEQAVDKSVVIQSLQSGGHVIFIRHGQTERDYADQVSAEMGNCASQRTLSEFGWAQAKSIGEALRALDVPVGEVISSEYCRAWQTADLAFGRYQKSPDLNFEPAEEYSQEQLDAMRERITPWLRKFPTDGTNLVLVGHDDPFDAATGIYPEPQGVSYILKPGGEFGFEVVTSIHPDDWPKWTGAE